MCGASFKHTESIRNLQSTSLYENLVGEYPTFNEIRHFFILFTTVCNTTNKPSPQPKTAYNLTRFKVYSKILLYCLNINTDCPLSSNCY
jgi:hypothetical protein